MVVIADGRYELPDNLFYSRQHVYLDKENKLIGLDQLGFAFLKNPNELKILVEKEVKIGEPMAVISTDYGITTLKSPVEGIIKTINGNALKNMENDTYTKGFLIEMEGIRDVDSKLINGKADIEKWANIESKCLLHEKYKFKIIEIGDSSVGKTAIKVRFTDDYFKQDLKSTLGVDFGSKELKIEYVTEDVLFLGTFRFTVKMNLWDAAGQAHYEKIRSMYYNGANGALLVYDVNNPLSFQNLDKWVNELKENVGSKIPVLLVGNKIDLPRKVTKEAALEYAKKNGFLYFECSAKTGAGVNQSFKNLATEIYKKVENL